MITRAGRLSRARRRGLGKRLLVRWRLKGSRAYWLRAASIGWKRWRRSYAIGMASSAAASYRTCQRQARSSRLVEAVKDIPIGILVNNAGLGHAGHFESRDPARLAAMMQVNCTLPVLLTRALIPAMVERKCGAVILVSSVLGLVTCPYEAVYAATKAFDLHLGESLYSEYRGTGIDLITYAHKRRRQSSWSRRDSRRRSPMPGTGLPIGRRTSSNSRSETWEETSDGAILDHDSGHDHPLSPAQTPRNPGESHDGKDPPRRVKKDLVIEVFRSHND